MNDKSLGSKAGTRPKGANMLYAPGAMPYALCPTPYALCPLPYALCPTPYALRPTPFYFKHLTVAGDDIVGNCQDLLPAFVEFLHIR